MPSIALFGRRKREYVTTSELDATNRQGILAASLPSTSSNARNAGKRNASLPAPPVFANEKTSWARGVHVHATAPTPNMYINEEKTNVQAGNAAFGEFGQLPQTARQQTSGSVVARQTYNAPPAFLTENSKRLHVKALPPIHVDTSNHSACGQNTKSGGNTTSRRLARRASTGSTPSLDGLAQVEELQLCYGYWPIETQRELSLQQIEEVVRLCGQEIKQRGIEAPLLFSTQALDITMDGVCSLIRSFLGGKEIWKRDLCFANPHDLCGQIKWALGRYINPQGARGFLAWDTFERWRLDERTKHYPPRYFSTNMLDLLPTQNAALLKTLFELFSDAIAYMTKNGCTPRKLATLFSAYIFGLPDDGTFEQTYTAFNRFSHATEHLLLAFIRDHSASQIASGAPTSIPKRLQELVKEYPLCLSANINKPPNGAALQRVVRIRRQVRFYSKNLITSAGSWEVPRSTSWACIAPFPNFQASDSTMRPAPFVFTARYRHLLNIRPFADEETLNDEELQRFGSVVEKEWNAFRDAGFAPPDSSKLKFDLTESERANRRRKHQTMDWKTFEGIGFSHGNHFDMELAFDPIVSNLNKVGILSDEHRKDLDEKARTLEKTLPPFNYDITPREEQSIQVDKQFFEVYGDLLCSSGWTRDEMKESNWALVQLRTRPKDLQRPPSVGNDGRSEETWFLVEEGVPPDYRAALLEVRQQKPKSSRRISFLRSVRKKPSKPPAVPLITGPLLGISSAMFDTVNRSKNNALPLMTPTANASTASWSVVDSRSGTPASYIDESVFEPGPGGSTKMLSLSKSISSAGMSQVSSNRGEDTEILESRYTAGVSSSPHRSNHSATNSYHPGPSKENVRGIGYTKDNSSMSDKKGSGVTTNGLLNLIRRTTRRPKEANLVPPPTTGVGRLDSPSPELQSSPGTPLSPGFDLKQHGVSGSGISINEPLPHGMETAGLSEVPPSYRRARPSFAGTTQSFTTQGTAGHSDTTTVKGSPGPTGMELSQIEWQSCHSPGTASSNIETSLVTNRDLPPPPLQQNSAYSPNQHIEAQYTQEQEAKRCSFESDANPYDGLADDEGASEETAHRTTFEADRPQAITLVGESVLGRSAVEASLRSSYNSSALSSPTTPASPSEERKGVDQAQTMFLSPVHDEREASRLSTPSPSTVYSAPTSPVDTLPVLPQTRASSSRPVNLQRTRIPQLKTEGATVRREDPRMSRLVTPNGTKVSDLISKYGGAAHTNP